MPAPRTREEEALRMAGFPAALHRALIASKANGPVETAISPSHSPNNPEQENVMDTVANNTSSAAPASNRNYPGHKTLLELVQAQDMALNRTHRFVQAVTYLIAAETLAHDDMNGRPVCIIDGSNADMISFLVFEMDVACREAVSIQEDIEVMARGAA